MRPILLLLLSLLPLPLSASVNGSGQDNGSPAPTYRLNTIAVVRERPNGRIVDVWSDDTLFTSNVAEGEWLRVTGTFPDDKWQPNGKPLWISRHYVETFTPKYRPTPSNRPPGVSRYVEVDKSTFELKVVEEKGDGEDVIFKTTVEAQSYKAAVSS
ncbi:MAG: hypothetical protein ACQETD_11205 [Pseudomonadota bacterium]